MKVGSLVAQAARMAVSIAELLANQLPADPGPAMLDRVQIGVVGGPIWQQLNPMSRQETLGGVGSVAGGTVLHEDNWVGCPGSQSTVPDPTQVRG